jgi:hypothetical protein
MCLPLLLVVLILFTSVVFADDFKTVDGKEYKSAKITRVEPDGIVLMNTVAHGGARGGYSCRSGSERRSTLGCKS